MNIWIGHPLNIWRFAKHISLKLLYKKRKFVIRDLECTHIIIAPLGVMTHGCIHQCCWCDAHFFSIVILERSQGWSKMFPCRSSTWSSKVRLVRLLLSSCSTIGIAPRGWISECSIHTEVCLLSGQKLKLHSHCGWTHVMWSGRHYNVAASVQRKQLPQCHFLQKNDELCGHAMGSLINT